jgi:LacI family transcriptional regulator
MATIKDVARLAGVAPSSVTRVLRGHRYVSDDLARRVAAAVEELGYRPDLVAAGLRGGRSHTVGVIVSDIINPVIAQLVDALETALHAQGYGTLLANSHGDPARDVENVERLGQRRVDGLVVMSVDERSPELVAALSAWSGPIVLADRQIPGLVRANAVLSDHRRGARALVSHLVDQGHRRIGYLGGPTGSTYVWRERTSGFIEALEDHGLPRDPALVKSARATPDAGRRSTLELLDLPEPPSAVVAGPNPLLSGTLQALHERGIEVGRDVALGCLDDVAVAVLHEPPITAVNRDITKVAQVAAELLLAQLTSAERHPRTVVLPVELRSRASTSRAFGNAEAARPPARASAERR